MSHILEIARQTFLLQLRSKLYWTLLGLSVAFACLWLFVPPNPGHVPGDELFDRICFIGEFIIVLPFIVLFLAVNAIHGDLEDRTSVYLFTRPVNRVWVLLGKWLAVVALGSLFALVSISALYVTIGHCGREWRHGALPLLNNYGIYLVGAVMAVAGYGAMGILMGTYFRRPMLLSMFYIVLEQIASRLPTEAKIHAMTVGDPVRRFLAANLEAIDRDLLKVMGHFGQDASEVVLPASPMVALTKLVVVTLGVGMWVYSRREYDARPSE